MKVAATRYADQSLEHQTAFELMTQISVSATRSIISDFAKEINRRKDNSKPSKAIIFFRNDQAEKKERDVYLVPINLLLYRKDNGRIASDVISYEKFHGPIDETSEEGQQLLGEFLGNKDPQKTQELKNSLLSAGQIDPAIITSDGFLINGNRRKLAMHEQFGESASMRVVILPGENDEAGPPTLREIEQIENRYQFQTLGKAEYYNFDKALSIRRKLTFMTLEEQLRDDPNYASLEAKDFERKKKLFIKEILGPLDCVDEYLTYLGRDGLYGTVSTGLGDPEGRWQAFVDYYHAVHVKLDNEKGRRELGIEEDEVGQVKDIAFKIIRKREIQDAYKVHKIMRDLPKLLNNPQSRKSLMALNDVPVDVDNEAIQESGEERLRNDPRGLDRIWGKLHESEFSWHVNDAYDKLGKKIEGETPISLLHASLDKLNDDKMRLDAIVIDSIPTAMQLSREIKSRAETIEHELYEMTKNAKKLNGKRN